MLLADCNAYFVCLTETWLKVAHLDHVQLDNYFLACYFCRSSCIGGGVGIYVRKGIEVTAMDFTNYECEKEFEVCGLECKWQSAKMVLINIYRPPESNFSSFISRLSSILSIVFHRNTTIFICADFNIDLKVSSKEQQDLINIFASYGLSKTTNE